MVKKLKESNSTIKKSLSMAITCLEDIVDELFSNNARDYSKIMDAIEICREVHDKFKAGKSINESIDAKPRYVRPNHNKLIDLMDEDLLNPRDVAECALSWMSDYDVGEMAKANGLFDFEELEESVESSVISIDTVANRLASWSADTTDEEYTEDRDDYVTKCYRSYLKDLKDKQFVTSVIDLISTRIKNISTTNLDSEKEDLEDDKEVLDMLKTWKKVNFSK